MLLTGSPKNLKIWNNLDFEKLEKKNLKIYFENFFLNYPKRIVGLLIIIKIILRTP